VADRIRRSASRPGPHDGNNIDTQGSTELQSIVNHGARKDMAALLDARGVGGEEGAVGRRTARGEAHDLGEDVRADDCPHVEQLAVPSTAVTCTTPPAVALHGMLTR